MALRGAWSTEHRAQSTGHRAQSFKQATGYRPELINSRACSLKPEIQLTSTQYFIKII